MIATCSLCGSDFLTEADPYIVRPTPQGVKLVCGCQIKGLAQADKLFEELTKLRAALDDAIDTAIFYSNSEEFSESHPQLDWSLVNNPVAIQDQGKFAREFLSKHKELIKGEV
jgi:hypothetical protein